MGGVGGGIRKDSPYPDYAAGSLLLSLASKLMLKVGAATSSMVVDAN